MARALRSRSADGADEPESDGRRGRRRRRGVVVGRGAHEFAGGPHAEVHALDDAGRASARRHALLHARALQPHRPNRSLRAARRRGGHSPRRDCDGGSEPATSAARGSRTFVTVAWTSRVASSRRSGARLNRAVLHRDATAAAVCHDQGRAELGWKGRVGARRADATDRTGGRTLHSPRAGGGRRDWGRLGTMLADDPLLTPRGAYRHRPLVRVVFDRRLRTPRRRGAVDARRRAGHNRHDGRGDRRRRRLRRAHLSRPAPVEAVDGAPGGRRSSAALVHLADLGVSSLVFEGGPTLHRASGRPVLSTACSCS